MYGVMTSLLDRQYPKREITVTLNDPRFVTAAVKVLLRRKNRLMRGSGRVYVRLLSGRALNGCAWSGYTYRLLVMRDRKFRDAWVGTPVKVRQVLIVAVYVTAILIGHHRHPLIIIIILFKSGNMAHKHKQEAYRQTDSISKRLIKHKVA